MSLKDNYEEICSAINDAAVASGRKYEDITFVAVTKFVEIPRIEEALLLGVTSVGENRVQELQMKLPTFKKANIAINLIGQLQTNKVKYVLGQVDLIQSLDRIELAKEMDKRSVAANIVSDALIEVNIGGEEQKGGVELNELDRFIDAIGELQGIRVRGLMCVPPAVAEPEARRYFANMHELFERLKSCGAPNVTMEHLSMGMSGDYRAAILEGATMVRIGTALFGKRDYGIK